MNPFTTSEMSGAPEFERCSMLKFRCAVVPLLLLSVLPLATFAQSIDFDDGTIQEMAELNLGLAGLPGPAYTFIDDGRDGRSIRVIHPAPPVAAGGPARAFLYFDATSYTDFHAAVDILAFDGELNQAFGLLVRGGDIGLGQSTGYVVNYNPNQDGVGGNDDAGGQFQINRIEGEAPDTIAAIDMTLDPSHRYRMVAKGVGSTLTGKIYDYLDLSTPVATITADDAMFVSGLIGIFNFNRNDDEPMLDPLLGPTDSTFDNFVASGTVPSFVGDATPDGVPGTPQIISHSPANYATLVPANNAIDFQVVAVDGSIDALEVGLSLNGNVVPVQVAVALQGNFGDGEVLATFDGLEENRIYTAQAMVAGTVVGQWTFDTFTQAHLNGDTVKIIEAEDYNYESGGFQNNPPVSGFTLTGFAPVRGSTDEGLTAGEGYLDAPGVNNIDFFTYHTGAGGDEPPDYRIKDEVGTRVSTDVRRDKYLPDDLPEYEIFLTEGGNWFNYTSTFEPGTYSVKLRAAAIRGQRVHLEQVTSDTSQPDQTVVRLGTFEVPNTNIQSPPNYVYTPLTESSGEPVALSLDGTTTLRLLIDGEQMRQTKFTMALNYLLFEPASSVMPTLVVDSATKVDGPYAVAADAVINLEAGTFTIDRIAEDTERYYKMRSTEGAAPRVTDISIDDTTVTVSFEAAN